MNDDDIRKLFVQAIRRDYSMIDRRDLFFLVKTALIHEEITLSRAAELLGLPLEEIRVLGNYWFNKDS
jgi:predicted HTH domain antitoxin